MSANDHIRPVRAALVILALQSHLAFSAVEFLSCGYAAQCAQAASAEGDLKRLPATGSNLGLSVIEICTRAIQGWDRDIEGVAESFNNRGVLYFSSADYIHALEDFESAVRKNPSLGQAHLNRGYALSALQRWQESIDAINTGISLTDEDAKAFYVRGIAHEELGNVRQAYLDYQRAANIDPEWSEPREALARFSIRQD